MPSSGSTRRIAYVPETVFGTTPATPSFKTFRATGGGPRTNKTTGTSDEIQNDRNVRDQFQLGQDVAGAYNFELAYGNLDDLLEGLLFSTWATNVLKNGTTPKSFTFEESFDLAAGGKSYSRFDGCMVNRMSLAIAARAAVTGTMELMGQNETPDTAIVTGATYAAAGTDPISTASANVAALAISGITPAPKVRSINLDINNSLRTRPLVGSLFTDSFGYGRCEVTGTIEAYFDSNDLYAAVLAHGSAGLSFTIGNASSKKYTFAIPKIIFGNGERRPGGNNDDVMVSIPFQGVYDSASAATISITRAVV